MPSTLIDTSVLIDLIEDRPVWFDWSSRQIVSLAEDGELLINQVTYGEASAPYPDKASFNERLNVTWLKREDLPWDAAFLAAKIFKKYRDGGGTKRTGMPDFLIGAHAMVQGHRLLTRDATQIRFYFPDLDIIAPDTHP